jgi:hypothetical protein
MGVFTRAVEAARERGCDVAATLSIPDPETGEKVSIRPLAFPSGDIRDVQTWVQIGADGCDASQKVGAGTGKVNVKWRGMMGEEGAATVAALFGVAAPGKPHRKRGVRADSVNAETGAAETNGAHAS